MEIATLISTESGVHDKDGDDKLIDFNASMVPFSPNPLYTLLSSLVPQNWAVRRLNISGEDIIKI